MISSLIREMLDIYRSLHPGELDWITKNRLKVKAVKRKACEAIQAGRQLPGRKKLLFWSTTSWERGGMEHMLSYAMLLRGHDIRGVTCGGGYASCSMDTVKSRRPSCDYCMARNQKLLGIFGLEGYYESTTGLVSEDKIRAISAEVDRLSPEQFAKYTYRGIEVGRIVGRDLPQYYFKIIGLSDPGIESHVREMLKVSSIYSECSYAILEKRRPDIAVVTSGKTISFAPFFEVCRKLEVPVITWDECGYEMDGFIFRVNHFANEFHLEKPWAAVRDQPLTQDQREFAKLYLGKTRKGDVGTALLYKNPIGDHSEIREQLGLRADKKLVVLLANITWDTSSLGRDTAFPGMFEWICATIDYFMQRPDMQVVVRCHPSEGNVPAFIRSDEKVSDKIKAKYGELPSHIRVIPGVSDIKSHELCEMSDLIAVYTTFVGLEMAVQGRRVLVCGQAHYRGKGFTTDVVDMDHYRDLLAKAEAGTLKDSTPDEIELAWRYAYFFINRINIYLPEFAVEHRNIFKIVDPADLFPGASQRWDAMCKNVEELGIFLDCTPMPIEKIQRRLELVRTMQSGKPIG